MNYDEIRVRYRQQRRNIISYIISEGLHNNTMKKYVHEQAKKIKPQDRTEFIIDVEEDLMC